MNRSWIVLGRVVLLKVSSMDLLNSVILLIGRLETLGWELLCCRARIGKLGRSCRSIHLGSTG